MRSEMEIERQMRAAPLPEAPICSPRRTHGAPPAPVHLIRVIATTISALSRYTPPFVCRRYRRVPPRPSLPLRR